jgi:hypothetical protein
MYLFWALFHVWVEHIGSQLYLTIATAYGCAAWAHRCRVKVPWQVYALLAVVHAWLGILHLW